MDKDPAVYAPETNRARTGCSHSYRAETDCNKCNAVGIRESRAYMPMTTSCCFNHRLNIPVRPLSAEVDLQEAQDRDHVVLVIVHLQLLQRSF